MRDTARQHMPSWAGGLSAQTATQSSERESRTAERLRNAASIAGAVTTGGAGAAAGAVSIGAAGGGGAVSGASGAANGRAYTPPPSAQADASGQGLQTGLQTPSFAGREQDFANEKFEAQFRERTSPVSAEQAKASLRSLPESTQRGIAELVSDHGDGAREHLAYHAMGEWSPQERDALRTLAGASDDVRSEAVKDVLADPAIGRPPEPPTDGAVASGGGPVGQSPAGGGGTNRDDVVPPGRSTPAQQSGPAQSSTPSGGGENGSGGTAPAREPRGPEPDSLFPDGQGPRGS
jgi:hypothetical protein